LENWKANQYTPPLKLTRKVIIITVITIHIIVNQAVQVDVLLKHMHLPLKSPHHHPPPILDARLIMTHVALVPEPLVGVGCVDGGIREAEHGRDERMQHIQPKMRLPWRHPILYTVERGKD
jgi:hypothetical protein